MLIQGQQSYNLPPLSRGSLSTTERTVPVVILLAEELLQQTLSTLLSTYWYLWGVEYRAKVICLFLLDFLSRGKTSNRTISTPPQSQYYFRFFSGHDKLRKMHVIKLSWNVLLQCGWYFAKLNGAQPQPYFNHRTSSTHSLSERCSREMSVQACLAKSPFWLSQNSWTRLLWAACPHSPY